MFNFNTEFAILRVIGKRMNSARLHSHWLINRERETILLLKQWKLFSVSSYRIIYYFVYSPLSVSDCGAISRARLLGSIASLSGICVCATRVCEYIFHLISAEQM
jgi:hypothetical protein